MDAFDCQGLHCDYQTVKDWMMVEEFVEVKLSFKSQIDSPFQEMVAQNQQSGKG